MKEMLCDSVFFGVAVSVLAYELGVLLKKKWKLAIFNPLLISILAVMLILVFFHIDYESYNQGAQYLSYLLTPATVCLAIPLYEQLEQLKRNAKAIAAGILSGVLTSLASVLALSILFGLTHEQYVTLLPKSITTAIGMGVSEELGGITPLRWPSSLSPAFWGMCCPPLSAGCSGSRSRPRWAIALGSSAHAIGTSKALELARSRVP